MVRVMWLLVLMMSGPLVALAQQPPAARLAERTEGLTRTDGFIPFYWDAARGRVLMEVPAFDADVLYYVSAASGAGSVEMSFDRGILESTVIHFQRSGPRVLVVQQNLGYRALDAHAALVESVKDSFASSVLAALPIEADEGGRVLVDATSLFMRDAADVVGTLRSANQGAFRFEPARSGFYPARMKAFPDNTEIETILTFAADQPGRLVANVTPDPRAFTLRIHHSFLRAPTGYTPRRADPRIGVSAIRFRDFGTPFNEHPQVEWITRWRLEKQNPGAAMSPPKKPIVFYLDPAIPEPIRGAMRDGALWWNAAFEAAGFVDAVQVRDPTPDMDPMDIRYAWILWINRDERGFSSGGTYRDPRTGEVLGSKTRMDSHRIRTIGNYFESYTLTTGGNDAGDDCGMVLPAPEHLLALAAQPGAAMPAAQRDLALLRQSLLTAHELGHVMGFGHNWASSINDRASVMEYPTPRVKVTNGRLDLSDAFQTSIGAYDALVTRYAYTEFPAGKDAPGLDAIVAEMRAKNILFVPSTDPRWVWYDDRATPTEYLRETMAARRLMLAQYGPGILQAGEPMGALRDMRLWMTYLHHRWAIEAGLGYVGGMYHNLAVKGEALPATAIVPAALQREVLTLLLETIAPPNLAMPETLLAHLTPSPGANLEDMGGDYAFDHLRAARILSAMVLEPLFEPARAARLVAFADRQPGTLSLPEVVDAVLAQTWRAPAAPAGQGALRRVTERVALDAMMMLGAHADTTPEVRAYVLDQIAALGASLPKPSDADPLAAAHLRQAARDITRYLENPAAHAPKSIMPGWGSRPRSRYPLPPGPPLG